MKDTTEIIKIVSEEVKSKITGLDIVTPEIFQSVYNQVLKEHSVDAEEIKHSADAYIETKFQNIQKITEQTSHTLESLNTHTKKAIEAMQNNDKSTLSLIVTETENLKKEIEKLRKALYTDELTKAKNRKYLYDVYLDKNMKFQKDGALVIVDLNYFKSINDEIGHIAGDKVLVYVVNFLKNICKEIVRYGGDEFLLLFDGKHTCEELETKLSKWRERIMEKRLKFGKVSFKVSFSFGCAGFKKGDIFTDVTERADKKMYEDKTEIKKKIKSADIQKVS